MVIALNLVHGRGGKVRGYRSAPFRNYNMFSTTRGRDQRSAFVIWQSVDEANRRRERREAMRAKETI